MRIHFYMPESYLPPAAERGSWMAGNPARLEQSGKAACVQCWIYLSFARLLRSGLRVDLVHDFPAEGVVVALTGNIPPGFRVPDNIFLIGVAADGTPHPSAHFHVLQNPVHARRLPRSTYIPGWSQPGLIPRDPDRGDRFENLVFFGDAPNLAAELRDPAFAEVVKARFGITFAIAGSERWHDYSDVDCVLAIRKFGPDRFLRKPATKLYNAWMAGVPCLGGNDSAFAADGRPGTDYIRCESINGVMKALDQLKNGREFRGRIVQAGRESARRFSDEAIACRWKIFLSGAGRLPATGLGRRLHGWTQRLFVTCDRLRGDR